MKILIVDDSQKDALLVAGALRQGGYDPQFERVDTADSMRAALAEGTQWDVIVTDHNMPTFNSLKALEVLKETGKDIPFIIVSGAIGEEIAVSAMKAGASDYLLKGNLTRLTPAIERELGEAQKRRRQKETQQQFEAIFENALDAILIADDNGNLVDVNPAACEVTGLTREVLLQGNIAQIFFPEEKEDYLSLWQSFIKEGQQRGEVTYKRPNSVIRYVEYTAKANFLPGRHVTMLRDITERREAEEALRKSKQELMHYTQKLERSNKELAHFAVIASHDLQAPLRKVRLFADCIKQSAGEILPDETKDFIERMQKSVARMQTLIDDLLDLSRVNRRGKPFEKVDLNKLIREVLAEQSEYIHAEDGQVEIGKMCSVYADPDQMFQLLFNLIENGIKFHKTDVPPLVKVNARLMDDNCEITVEDNGIGFKEKYLDRIFEIFQRLHGENAYPGTGVGLALCQKIVERHQGTITAQSQPGIGSKFTVRLPISPSQR